MSFFRTKKNIIIIISLVSAILFSTLAVLIANFTENKQNVSNNTNETVSALVKETDCDYVFGGYGLYVGGDLDNAPTKDDYNGWTNVGIENAYGLMAFSHSVAKGYSFSGKNVYLLNNINGNTITNHSSLGNYVPIGANMWSGTDATTEYKGKSAFAGTFDGQNFTVSNLICKVESRDGDSNDIHLGFFAQLVGNAIVQNLRIDGFTISNYDNKVNTLIGGVVGYGNLTEAGDKKINIKNCLVKNLNVTVKDSATVAGGLVGYAKIEDNSTLNLENCAVDTFTCTSSVEYDSVGGLIAKTYTYIGSLNGGLSYDYGKLNILNCHLKDFSATGSSASYIANLSPARGTVYSTTLFTNPDALPLMRTYDNTYFSYDISKCVVQVSNTYDNIKDGGGKAPCASSDIITDAQTTTGLDCSSVGGESDTYPWYYAAAYNYGYPYLRQFLSWSDLGFSTHGTNAIEQWVSVPSDGVDDAHKSLASQLSYETLDVFGTSVEAELTDPYNFDGWTKSGNNYYAQFSLKTFKVSFVKQENTTNTSSNLSFNTDYYIYYEGTITITYVSYTKQGYSSITYSFTDTGGTTRSITYSSSNGYYISSTSLNSLTNITVYKNYTGLSVKTSLKTYTPSFE
ncbi:MAG: hypothetical protein J6Q13_02285 [Clostridia bacterium]|nr:hypothetical protein [Clostridia bacterium]